MKSTFCWSLAPRALAVSACREKLRSCCSDLPPPLLDDALLLTSELVTNAVRHGSGEITCRLWAGPEVVRLEVTDADPRLPHPVEADIGAESGRGLQIVDTVASRWGATTTGTEGGKTVWFELDTGLA